MARERERARQAQRREQIDGAVADLRRQGRRWLIRAVLAGAAGALVSLLTVGVAALLGILALGCLGLGLREAVAAQRLEDAG